METIPRNAGQAVLWRDNLHPAVSGVVEFRRRPPRSSGVHPGLRLHGAAQPAGSSGTMSSLELGFWSFPVLLAMIFLRVPIGLAMLLEIGKSTRLNSSH